MNKATWNKRDELCYVISFFFLFLSSVFIIVPFCLFCSHKFLIPYSSTLNLFLISVLQSLYFPLLPPSLSHSETTSTGRGTTSWAWPGSPKTSWPRSPTSSSPTWGPAGSSRRRRRLPTHLQHNLSKPRYEEPGRSQVSESGVSWTLRAKYFHFPKAALYALSSWITVVFLVFRKLHVGPGECRFRGQEKPMRVCLLPLSSIPVNVWNFIFSPGKPGESLESLNLSWIQETNEGRNERGKEGQLWTHCKENVSRQNKGITWS